MPTQTARARSNELLTTKEYPSVPVIDSEWSEEERKAQLEAIKPLHYARLAEVIDLLFANMQERKAKRPPTGFIRFESKYVACDDSWQQLRSDSIATIQDAIEHIKTTEQFKETAAINRFIGTLDPNRFIDLYMQLLAGMNTAASSMLTHLKSVPLIVAHHNPSHKDKKVAIARKSIELPMRLAMTCVDRMMAAQTALAGGKQQESWVNIDQVLNAAHFNLQKQEDGIPRIEYVHFTRLEVPKGYKNGPDHIPIPQATRVGKLACYQATIIGCPFTLLAGRMQELWDWYIDIVENQGMWEK